MSQLHLLRERRYWPLFWTQFFGAFNDNLFKNALVIMVAYREISVLGMPPDQVVFLCGGVFILPFFLFSPIAGQLSDKYQKSRLIRWVKMLEVVAMGIAALGFFLDDVLLLIFVLFLMGFQSALFGPAKYSVLPELVTSRELVGANALVESGTFLSILIGTITGGVLASFKLPLSGDAAAGGPTFGSAITAVSVIAVAIVGVAFSLAIQRTEPGDRNLRVRLSPIQAWSSTFRVLRREPSVFHSVMGISWFWFFGLGILSLMPSYCRDVLRGSEHVATFCLALFCVGIGAGSILCERLSQHRLELGLVPLGSLGLSVFVLDLFVVGSPYAPGQVPKELLGIVEYLKYPQAWRISFDLLMTAMFGGIFSVPLYTLVQQRSPRAERSRVIAGNNVMNSGFMVLTSVLLMGLSSLGLTTVESFLVLSLMNVAVAIYIYGILPEFMLRFVVWGLSKLIYRVKVSGRERIPDEGPCVIVANHVTFVDWMIIAAVCPRPARFVMYHRFLKLPVAGLFFRDAKVIPIAPAHEDQGILDAAYDQIARELEAGEVVCIFPEGKLTLDGNMNPFRTGIERILERTPVPVVPMAIVGMWGSIFSRRDRGKVRNPLARLWSKVRLVIGEPLDPAAVNASKLAKVVADLGDFRVPSDAT